MLNVYIKKEEIPKGMRLVDRNDSYFELIPLQKSEDTDFILKSIDRARYNSEFTFTGRSESLGAIFKNSLSTGCKTALNVLYSPDVCFDIVECGNNAINTILKVSKGNIYWGEPCIMLLDDFECEIMVNGKLFTDVGKFADYIDSLWEEGYIEGR